MARRVKAPFGIAAVLAAAGFAGDAGAQTVAVGVDLALDRGPISPLIYGMNFADAGVAAELRLPLNRWGGNATTRYNWRLDAQNRASDYFFENIPNTVADVAALPDGSSTDRFVQQNAATGTASLLTISTIGWTPRDRTIRWGFSVSRYGAQQQTDPYRPDAGNGVRTSGADVTGNDPADTSAAVGPAFQAEWVGHLVSRFGPASAGGVRFYDLDNEPDLWWSTHRDVAPLGYTYDQLRQWTIDYATAVKGADPGARLLGPVSWGWSGYFFSPRDTQAGQYPGPDRLAHGNQPLVGWYLDQMRLAEGPAGRRLLDYLDLHYYPQASGVALAPAGSAATRALRLRATRSLWDPEYIDESWISQTDPGTPVRLIPRMRDWANAHYPGTKLAVTEYNFGGLEDVNGALAQADALGIFGREGLDLACLWAPPAPTQPGTFAFRMFLNYDGSGTDAGRFGSTRVRAASADQSAVSAYAAERVAGTGTLTLVLINKTTAAQGVALTVDHLARCGGGTGGVGTAAAVYEYGRANPSAIVRRADVTLAPAGATTLTLAAESITLLAVPFNPADFRRDGAVDLGDIFAFLNAWFAGSATADFDGRNGADLADIFAFLRAWFAGCP